MRHPLSVPVLSKLEQDLASIFLNPSNELILHKEEIFSVCYASPFIKRVCLSQAEWLEKIFTKGGLQQDYRTEQYRQLLKPVFDTADSVEELQKKLREVRANSFARIAWRDLQSYSSVEQTLDELSSFADICLQETLQWCFEWIKARPHVNDFVKKLPQNIIIFALGKLGGSELNFSSDVDVVFAYVDKEQYTQEQLAKASEFYLKVIQLFIKVLSEQTQDGFVFRVDTRLRPFGESGALLPSFSAIDQYFQTHGRDWERYAWMKARVIAGDVQIGEQFLQDVAPFIYRRYLDYGAMQSLREMKLLIEEKARLKTENEDLKIGVGGIREIEFITQMFQLTYGGKNSSLRLQSTLKGLMQLQEQGLLSSEWVGNLTKAYLFLRKAENALQLREDQQIHVLPKKDEERNHYAYCMSKQNWQDFYAEYEHHSTLVNELFQSILNYDDEQSDYLGSEYESIWNQIDEEDYCLNIMKKYFSEHTEYIYQHLKSFQQSSRVQKLIPIARSRLDKFIPIFLQELSNVDEPIIVFDRFINMLKKIVQRSTYISLLIENKNKLSVIFVLMQASPWVAQYLSTHPVLLDEVISMDGSYEPPSLLEMQDQLKANLINLEPGLDKYMEALREFKHSQVIQIAAADVVEDYSIMKVSDHLSWLAEVCINNALQYAYRELVKKYGQPQCVKNGQAYIPEVLIVEYGKLGGLELGYGSDLDIVFLHNSLGSQCETSGIESNDNKKIHNDVFFARLVQRTIHILTTVTSNGKVFDTDLRLRPHGESGPVITSLHSYEKYLINDAWLWEHQALVRSRAVTSSSKLADEFARIRKKVLCQTREIKVVQTSVVEMRNKMLSANKGNFSSDFNIKKDVGGLIDIEFIVQFLVLSYAAKFPQLCEYTDNVRILDRCAEIGLIEEIDATSLKEVYLKYRKYLHQLNLQLEADTTDPNVFAKEREVVQNYWVSLLHSGST